MTCVAGAPDPARPGAPALLNPRRLKLAYVRNEELLSALCAGADRRPVLRGVPEGARVVAASYDLTRAGWALTLEHPSWDDVPWPELLPEVPVELADGPDDRTRPVTPPGPEPGGWRDRPPLL